MQQDKDEDEEEVESIDEESGEETLDGLYSKGNDEQNHTSISTQERRRQLIWKLTSNHPVLK